MNRQHFVLPPRLWRVPVYLPYLQPRLTEAAVARAEAKLGVRLPRAYLEALRIQNGGYLRLSEHPSDRAAVDCLAGIGPRFPSLLRFDWDDVKAHMAEEGITRPARIDDLIPFSGDGHYHFCFDYRKGGRKREPRVTYVDVECFDVDEVLAPDFGTFLHQLRPSRESAFGLVTREPPELVAAAVSKVTGLPFEDQGEEDHGYRLFRARLPGKATGWVWLSANEVRRGFVRKTDRDHAKLHTRLPERVDRHPDHSDCGYFVTVSDLEGRQGKAAVRALEKLPFPARALSLE